MAVKENTTVTTDIEPGISIDHEARLVDGIKKLQEILGVTEMTPLAEGTVVKQYKLVKKNSPAQVDEGDEINLTKISREAVDDRVLTLNKYRRLTTAEAIQRSGYDTSINKTDDKLIAEIRKDIKTNFFASMITQDAGTANGTNLQKACANLWAKLQTRFEDIDVTPVFFINPQDVADYLGDASISTQDSFGFSYIESFLGMGTAIVTGKVDAKKPVATVSENLNGVYVPANGELASAFNLTMDESGLIGMSHNIVSDRASIDTLAMSGVLFYPEEVDGVFQATIQAAA